MKKSFAGKPALRGVDFSVARGEIFGLLGHNGAGKSTTLGALLGMVTPDAGETRIDGIPVQRNRAQALAKVGAIFESPGFYDYLSGYQNLKLLTGYSGGVSRAALDEVVARVELDDRIHSKVGTYSHGMRQRLALAQALLPEPEVLLLDEPTDGLDPEGIKWFRDFILNLRAERGMTVLFNSHLLAEVEQMCDRVVILQEGRKVFEGSGADLEEDELILHLDLEPAELRSALAAQFGGRAAGEQLLLPKNTDIPALVTAAVEKGGRVREVRRVRRSLEDLYLQFSRKVSR
ncbi:ABC transporter ATP-binding protein [Roseibacillus ishigakijimensis]|uniref:ABC transporter ATP-binding protein n=1 Tax=Roseibacillus ishigakijimensis TaxID=454146 RepID=A0A934RQ95_9BACT|nr:ABC transporter ATP-binding protein [Roseibacillus ishigakijimensis]